METIRAIGSALWSIFVYVLGVVCHIAVQVAIALADAIGGLFKKGVDKVSDKMTADAANEEIESSNKTIRR